MQSVQCAMMLSLLAIMPVTQFTRKARRRAVLQDVPVDASILVGKLYPDHVVCVGLLLQEG